MAGQRDGGGEGSWFSRCELRVTIQTDERQTGKESGKGNGGQRRLHCLLFLISNFQAGQLW